MTLQLCLLGAVTLRRTSEAQVRPIRLSPKPLALLAYLALAEPRGLQRRDKLVALLWPDLDDQHAKAALRQALHTVRAALGADLIESIGTGEIGLVLEQVVVDVEQFRLAAAGNRCDQAVQFFRGPLLDGIQVDQAPGYMEWLDHTRSELSRTHARCLEGMAARCEKTGEWHAALEWWNRMMASDRLNVRVLAGLVRCQAAGGDPAGALARAEEFTCLVRQEIGVDPAPQLQASFAEGCRLGAVPQRRPSLEPVALAPTSAEFPTPLPVPSMTTRYPEALVFGVFILALVVLATFLTT